MSCLLPTEPHGAGHGGIRRNGSGRFCPPASKPGFPPRARKLVPMERLVYQASAEHLNGRSMAAGRQTARAGGLCGGSVRPASARQPGADPNRSALVSDMPGLVLSAGMCTVGLLPKEVTDSLTQQLEEREGGGTILSFTNFF
ncbi:hypothetical protein HJG60_008633 [Phyllostomus discolor]|uniref:Uncharacterized protein n=1 Tax=Phyllostomus discolor TaxID=89673 RepID=A0A833Z1Q3_9CHIR|nr:hypothetical protein HJG60_008633 [Phyllostomus discolor]